MSHMARIRAYTNKSREELGRSIGRASQKLGFKCPNEFKLIMGRPEYVDTKFGFKEVYKYKGKPVLEGKAICYGGHIIYSTKLHV